MRYVERYVEKCGAKIYNSKSLSNGNDLDLINLDQLSSISLDQSVLNDRDDEIKNKFLKPSDCKATNPLRDLLSNLCYQVAYCDEKHQTNAKTKNEFIIIK